MKTKKINLISDGKRIKKHLRRKNLRKKKFTCHIKYAPKNTSQFLIKNHSSFGLSEEEELIPFGSMLDEFDLNSENSTMDEEEEKKFNLEQKLLFL